MMLRKHKNLAFLGYILGWATIFGGLFYFVPRLPYFVQVNIAIPILVLVGPPLLIGATIYFVFWEVDLI